MTLKTAIEKVIEVGWEPKPDPHLLSQAMEYLKGGIRFYTSGFKDGTGFILSYEEILLDPLFWQSLGKSMGWEKGIDTYPYKNSAWKEKWHSLIDHLASGGSIEDFFNEIK